jgi:hypothetical protein
MGYISKWLLLYLLQATATFNRLVRERNLQYPTARITLDEDAAKQRARTRTCVRLLNVR